MTPASGNEGAKNGKPLKARQEEVASLLAAGQSVPSASQQCNVSPYTVYRWLKTAAFTDRVAQIRKEMTDRAIGRLADLMCGQAADTLARLLEAKSEKTQLEAARSIYEIFVTTKNSADLQARLEQLEQDMRRGGQ